MTDPFTLTLRVKKEYFDAMVSGLKTEEYRRVCGYWERRICGWPYDRVMIIWGYPRREDLRSGKNYLFFPWRGYVKKTITHPFFRNVPTEVYAIPLTEPGERR